MNSVQEQKCHCCESTDTVISHQNSFFDLPVLRCNNCFYHFVNYRNNSDEIRQYYQKTYWSTFRNIDNKKLEGKQVDNAYPVKKFPVFIQRIIDHTGVRKSLSHSQFRFTERYIKGKNLLEIGSGEGFVLELFEKKGFNVNGIEASKDNLRLIKKKLRTGECKIGFAEDLPDYDKKFDVIIMSHVLEHLINCRLVISSLRELLAEDGIIFIEVPNCEDLITLEHSVFTQPHLHHFTEKSFEFLFKSCGYEIIKSDIFFSHVVTLAEHIKYMLKWFLKIDCYTKGTNSHGNILRLIVSKTRKH